jgi:hypothetical protein
LRAWLIGDNMADKNRTQEKSKKAMTKKARLRKKKVKSGAKPTQKNET